MLSEGDKPGDLGNSCDSQPPSDVTSSSAKSRKGICDERLPSLAELGLLQFATPQIFDEHRRPISLCRLQMVRPRPLINKENKPATHYAAGLSKTSLPSSNFNAGFVACMPIVWHQKDSIMSGTIPMGGQVYCGPANGLGLALHSCPPQTTPTEDSLPLADRKAMNSLATLVEVAGRVEPILSHGNPSTTKYNSQRALRSRYNCVESGCGKIFPSRSRLQRHLLVHTGLKPFNCLFSGCDRMFSRKDNMLQHYRTHVIRVGGASQEYNAQENVDQVADGDDANSKVTGAFSFSESITNQTHKC